MYMYVLLVVVALKNREVRVYKDRFLVNTIILEVRTVNQEYSTRSAHVLTCTYVRSSQSVVCKCEMLA